MSPMKVAGCLLLLIAVPLLATVTSTAEEPGAGPVVVVEDPQGDATETSAATATGTAYNACLTAAPASYAACGAVGGTDAGPTAEQTTAGTGTPAPPALDILSVAFLERPTQLDVILEVASLDADFRDHDGTGVGWEVEWTAAADGTCGEAVWLGFKSDGTPHAALEHWDARCIHPDADDPWSGYCNEWSWCTEKVAVSFDHGSPATITWHVPRASLFLGELGETLYDTKARTTLEKGGMTARWHAGLYTDPNRPHGMATTASRVTSDRTDEGTAWTLQQARAAVPADPEPSFFQPFPASDTPESLDLLGVTLLETSGALTFKADAALVEVAPEENLYVWLALGLPSRHVLEAYASATDGEWGVVSALRTPSHGDPLRGYQFFPPVQLNVTPGSPGSIEITFQRTDLPMIEAGGQTNLFVLMLGPSGESALHQHPGPANLGLRLDGVEGAPQGDYTFGLPRYEFKFDSPRLPASLGRLHEDDQGDVVLSQAARAGGAQPDLFDVTYLEVRLPSDGMLRFTMGIKDLGGLRVPLGYDAVFYAFGVETADGSRMVGYHKDADEAAGTFLCATDTTVLSDQATDPTSAVWTPIGGLLRVAGGDGGSGGGGPGSITWLVPPECLGHEEGDTIDMTRLEAGSYLVQSPTGRAGEGLVEQADHAAFAGAVVLAPEPVVASALAPATAWYWWALRFGGLVGAPATFFLARRARRRDKAAEQHAIYRAALEESLRAGKEPNKADELLVGLRKRFGISDRMHATILAQAREGTGRAPSTLAPGAVFLERYRVEKVIGQGGFAFTYLAQDATLGRDVVLKVARLPTAKEQQRVLDEARVLARLGHPNIVTVLDAEQVGDEVVIVLEYVRGGSLAERLQDGPLPPRQYHQLLQDVTAGLAAAHKAGVVHRDVKPANILLTEDGTAKLADFGIAHDEGTGTVTGGSLRDDGAGTVAYMAPEQARGQPADHRADIYAFGAVAYEAATGRTYIDFDGLAEFEARLAIIDQEPRLPVVGLDAATNDLLAACLQKDRALRPRSIADVRDLMAAAIPVN